MAAPLTTHITIFPTDSRCLENAEGICSNREVLETSHDAMHHRQWNGNELQHRQPKLILRAARRAAH